jgi:hypothetical protein
LPLEVVPERVLYGGEFGVGAQHLERRSGLAARGGRDRESSEVVDPVRGGVLEPNIPGVSNSTSRTARSEGASRTSSTNVSHFLGEVLPHVRVIPVQAGVSVLNTS